MALYTEATRIGRMGTYMSPRRLFDVPRDGVDHLRPIVASQAMINRRAKRLNDENQTAATNQLHYQEAVQAINDFDTFEPMFHIMQQPGILPHMWGWGRRLAQSYLGEIFTNWPSELIMRIGSPLVQHNGARMEYAVATDMINVALIMILSIGAGPDTIAEGRIISLNNKPQAMALFVKPLVADLMSCLSDYHDYESMDHYLNVNLSNRLKHLVEKKMYKGVWSKRCMLLKYEGNHPQQLLINPQQHMHDCKGIEFSFMQILEQFSRKMRKTVPKCAHARAVTRRCLLDAERNLMRRNYDTGRDMRIL